MSTKQCLKCGHTTSYDGAPPLACPQCEAIYAKVEEALKSGAPIRPKAATAEPEINFFKATPATASQSISHNAPDVHAFAQHMRAESLYPAWRKIVGFATVLGYIAAALVLIGAVVSSGGSGGQILIGAGSAALIALLARISKEFWLMLADLSDAAVHLAAQARMKD